MDLIPEFLKPYVPFLKTLTQNSHEVLSYPDVDPVTSPELIPLHANMVVRLISYCIIHHSAVMDGPNLDTPSIKAYHMSYRVDGNSVSKEEYARLSESFIGDGKHHLFELPDVDVAYNLLIEKVGGGYAVQAGRSMEIFGAHTKQLEMNKKSVGICALGNFDKAPPELECWDLTIKTVKQVQSMFGIPTKNVLGHREVYTLAGIPQQKTCPGVLFDMDKFRANLDTK